ncbi:GNAT family N-acetyltransferase [Nissabacter sp. SGAir0207]|uniref:GNAT family N-acetyltransferase n=1 Tax=Nissabacter sp. SGAir0207 TaxID=2126321 RepID=UPI0010CD42D3|nr:GNAT family N-acetyltransferase [Nissabacter sp. SGAir0207]QCR35421.1 GNAT family N-acetyltransferase [Nissabacter sp. SGAir0207]
MQLETARLILSPLTERDWPLFQQLQQNPQVMAFVADRRDETEVRQHFESRLPAWNKESHHWLCLVIRLRKTGEAIGVTGFMPEWAPYRQAEIGYMLLPAFQGQGYATESLNAVCDYAFELGFHRLKALVVEGNRASRRVLEKCGFAWEGTLRDNYLLGGEWENDWLLARIAPE